MKTLDQIARECGTDKSSDTHNYAVKYDNYLSQYRDKKIKFFEIGVIIFYCVIVSVAGLISSTLSCYLI